MSISLDFHDVCFSYNSSKQIFDQLNHVLPEDKTILLTGENGVGKSTFAYLAAGLLKPLSGKINYKNNGITLTKHHNIYTELSYLQQVTADNVLCATPLEDLAIWFTSSHETPLVDAERLSEILLEWNLETKKNNPVWELSAGELKSLAFAGISIHKNKYWILDEPTTSLDDIHNTLVLENLKAKQIINRGMLIISHRTRDLEHLADAVLTLTPDGRIV